MGCSVSQKIHDVTVPCVKANNFFQASKVGAIEVKNRFVMAAMSRSSADPATDVSIDFLAEYYSERAGFGLIITDCSQASPISSSFLGYEDYNNQDQLREWKHVVETVHDKGSKIVLQLWHSGRAVLKEQIGGADPIAPSALAIRSLHPLTSRPHTVPREMTQNDIDQVVEEYRESALLAKKAGFDGVQLNAADGYLVDQFLKDGTNKRKDEYGGSIQNRAKFLFQCLDALISVFGASKVGVKFSPTGRQNDMYDSDPLSLMRYVLKECENKHIAYVEIKRHSRNECSKQGDNLDQFGQTLPHKQIPHFFEEMRKLYSGILIANDSINYEEGTKLLAQKTADLISFAQLAIANPDLVDRYKHGWKLKSVASQSPSVQNRLKGHSSLHGFEQTAMNS